MMIKNENEGIGRNKKKRKRDMVNAYNDFKGDHYEEFSESDEDSEQKEYQV